MSAGNALMASGIIAALIAMHSVAVVVFFWWRHRRLPNADEFWAWLKDSIGNSA